MTEPTAEGADTGADRAARSAATDEALGQLAAAAQEWARRAFPDAGPHEPAECQWCPLCQLARMLRGDRPDLTAALSEGGAALLAAARTLLEAVTAGATAEPSEPDAGPRSRVERIDLGGDLDGDDLDGDDLDDSTSGAAGTEP
jgi:hypothetical protein